MKKRTEEAAWLRQEILRLAKEAESNVREDAENAKNTNDPAEQMKYEMMSETARHYAKELRRILAGKTWDEKFAETLREARR